MKKIRSILVAGGLLAILVALPSAYAAAEQTSTNVIVGFKSAPGANARALVQSVGGQVVREYSLIPAVAANVPAQAVKKLESNSAVSYVEEVQHRTPTSHIVEGELWAGAPEILPWGVDKVKADEVWDTNDDLTVDGGATAGQGVEVAVLDSGLDTTHPDLVVNWNAGDSFDFIDNDPNVSDIPGPVTGHGTATSGIVAAVDNAVGVIGVAPKTTFVMYRVCDSSVAPSGDCPDSAIIAALEEAVEDDAHVVSMSFGGFGFSQALKDAVKAVGDAGIVQVASAGNTPSPVAGARHYPSGFSEVIAVGATDEDDNLATFSTFGGHQELVAPGVGTPTTFLQDKGLDATLSEDSPTVRTFGPNPMAFSGVATLKNKRVVFANLGQPADFAAVNCTGRIALIQRGAITFRAKVENAEADGCVGAIIYNNVAGNFFGTLGVQQDVPAVSLSNAEGLALKADVDAGTTIVDLTMIAIDYESFSGTSASAPHVSGVAALVLSEDSSLSSGDVRSILQATATDLGDPGRDNLFGFGLVNAEEAVDCAAEAITCELP